jgi:hypothetical protein
VRFSEQFGQTVTGISAVGFLGAEAAGSKHDLAAGSHLAARKCLQPREHFRRQAQREDIEPHLHGSRYLVDILPAGSSCGDEAFAERSHGAPNYRVHRLIHS